MLIASADLEDNKSLLLVSGGRLLAVKVVDLFVSEATLMFTDVSFGFIEEINEFTASGDFE